MIYSTFVEYLFGVLVCHNTNRNQRLFTGMGFPNKCLWLGQLLILQTAGGSCDLKNISGDALFGWISCILYNVCISSMFPRFNRFKEKKCVCIYGSASLGTPPPPVFLLMYRLVESIYLLCLAVSRLKGV